jgi:hypothetical protein
MATATYSNNRDVHKLVRELVRAGWTVRNGGVHKKLVAPCGSNISIPGSTSDHRSFLNFRADVRRVSKNSTTPENQ